MLFMRRPSNWAWNRSAIRVAVSALTLVCVSLASATLFATPLAVGSAILSSTNPGTGGGVIVADTGPLPFASATFTGTLRSEVLNNDPANPNGPGFYTFIYSLTNIGGPNSIGRLTVPGYGIANLLTDASYVAVAGNIPPTSFDRGSAATLGDVVGTSFTAAPLGFGEIPPGVAGDTIVIHTNTNRFAGSVASVIDGSTAQVATFAPLPFNPVPEPSTVVLGMLGFSAVVVARRRFQRR